MEQLKSGLDWEKDYKNEFDILDYDGWDRANFEESFAEEITLKEFMNRVIRCTCMFKKPPIDAIGKIEKDIELNSIKENTMAEVKKKKKMSMKDAILSDWKQIPAGTIIAKEEFLISCRTLVYGMIATYHRRFFELAEKGRISFEIVRPGIIKKTS